MEEHRPALPPSGPDGKVQSAADEARKPVVGQTVWQGLATVGSLGFTLVACTFFGLASGYMLDRWLGSGPWLTILFLLLGIAAGFINIFFTAARLKKPSR